MKRNTGNHIKTMLNVCHLIKSFLLFGAADMTMHSDDKKEKRLPIKRCFSILGLQKLYFTIMAKEAHPDNVIVAGNPAKIIKKIES